MLLALLLLTQPQSLFLDLCRTEATPACTVYLAGFMHALSAQGKICPSKHPNEIAVGEVRLKLLNAVRERGAVGASEGAVMIGELIRLYPCKEK